MRQPASFALAGKVGRCSPSTACALHNFASLPGRLPHPKLAILLCAFGLATTSPAQPAGQLPQPIFHASFDNTLAPVTTGVNLDNLNLNSIQVMGGDWWGGFVMDDFLVVPEPSALVLMAAGGLLLWRRMHSHRSQPRER